LGRWLEKLNGSFQSHADFDGEAEHFLVRTAGSRLIAAAQLLEAAGGTRPVPAIQTCRKLPFDVSPRAGPPSTAESSAMVSLAREIDWPMMFTGVNEKGGLTFLYAV
jgi:hypothetical protein